MVISGRHHDEIREIGLTKHNRHTRYSVGKHAIGGGRGERGSAAATINGGAARSASCLTGGVSPGTDARSAREEAVGVSGFFSFTMSAAS